MTLPTSGQISFSGIEEEFGQNGSRSLGDYRLTQAIGTLSARPLDTGIPSSGQIKFSDFHGKELNIVVDCHSSTNGGSSTYNHNAYTNRFKVGKFNVIGNFKTSVPKSAWNGGKTVIININQTFGSSGASNRNHVAFDVGAYNNNVNQDGWPTTTELSVVLGSNAYVAGKGGNGGEGGWVGDTHNAAGTGGEGTSAMKIHSGMSITGEGVNVNNHIIAGGGGGGGGYGGDSTFGGNDEGVPEFSAPGSGGGGGAGLPAGSGGLAGEGTGFRQGRYTQSTGDSPIHDGEAGTLTTGGSAGQGVYIVLSTDEDGEATNAATTGVGGNGGGNGQSGGNGSFGNGWGFDNGEESGQEVALGGNGGFRYITY